MRTYMYTVLAALLLAALAAPALPGLVAGAAGFGASIITYDVPITIIVKGNTTVPAATTVNNTTTPGTANINLSMPFIPSPSAQVTLAYKLTDSNGTVLSSGNGISIKMLDADHNNTVISTIYLSSDSPAEALVPLAAPPQTRNITIAIENSLSASVSAQVQVIVVDTAKFNVTVDKNRVQLSPGQSTVINVNITQVSGPSGQLILVPQAPQGIETSVEPRSFVSVPGKSANVKWTIKVDNNAKSGTYDLRLVGRFGYTIANTNVTQEYTFAELVIPATVAYAAGGFALGSIFGASFGWGAAVIAVLIIIVLAALMFGLIK